MNSYTIHILLRSVKVNNLFIIYFSLPCNIINRMKKRIIINIVVLAAMVIGGYFIFNSSKKVEAPVTVAENQEQQPPAQVEEPPSEPQNQVKLYTMEEVGTHKDTTSCWSVVRGSVYELTDWIAKHPGGKGAVLGICGKDGTDKFVGRHGGLENQEAALATLKMGELK